MTLRASSFFLLIIYCFQTARHLSNLYLIILTAAFFIFAIALIAKNYLAQTNIIEWYVILLLLYGTLMTILNAASYGSPNVGIARLWVSAPLIIIGFILGRKQLDGPLRFIALFFILAALSYPLQYLIGPIGWFAEASERAGGMRFASLAGSLTAYGVLLGVPVLYSLWFLSGPKRICVIGILTVGALLSLQKAALGNIALAIAMTLWLKKSKRDVLGSLVILCIVGLALGIALGGRDGFGIGIRYVQGIATGNGALTDDVSFGTSIVDRLSALPITALSFFGQGSLMAGAGSFGGAGALGYEDLPMAHNGFVELILIFGYIFGGITILLLSWWGSRMVFCFVRPKRYDDEQRFLAAAYILWIINYIFSGGVIFQPIGAAIFWLIIGRSWIRWRSNNKTRHEYVCNEDLPIVGLAG